MLKPFSAFVLLSTAVGAQAQSFVDGFENATYTTAASGGVVRSAVNWTVVNASAPIGTSSYFDGDTNVFRAYEGSHYVAANFRNVAGTGTIDDYLMTPTLSLSDGDTFSFFTRHPAGTFPDRLLVKLSLAGDSILPSDFGTTLLTINPSLTTAGYPTDWTQYSVTLSGIGAARSGRLAFDYNVTNGGPKGANSDTVGIDAVRYTAFSANPVPEPASCAALALGALGLLRRRRKA